MKNSLIFRPMKNSDWKSVVDIYRQGLETGNATFETKTKSKSHWNKNHLKSCRIIAVLNNKIVGWAALSPVSNRKVYEGVAEVSIYIDEKYRGIKIGSKLLNELIIESEKKGIWTLQASIFPENIASIKMNRKSGFRKVGIRKKIGKMDGKWRDTLLMERRSKNII